MQPSDINKGVMSPLVNERMRKRRCFADKELEMVMLERERQAEVLANHRRTLHHVMHTHSQQVAYFNGLRMNTFQRQSALNFASSRSTMLQEGMKRMHGLQEKIQSTKGSDGMSSPREFLQKVFPAHNASLIELVWQGCGGDLERTIEQLAKGMEPAPVMDKSTSLGNTDQKTNSPRSPTPVINDERRMPGVSQPHKFPMFSLGTTDLPSISAGPSRNSHLKSTGSPTHNGVSPFYNIYSPLVLSGSVLMPPYPSAHNLSLHAPKANMDNKAPKVWHLPQGTNNKDLSLSTTAIKIHEKRFCKNDLNRDSVQSTSPSPGSPSSYQATTSTGTPESCNFTSSPLSHPGSAQDPNDWVRSTVATDTFMNTKQPYNAEIDFGKTRSNVHYCRSKSPGSLRENSDNENQLKETSQASVKRAPPLKFSVEAIMGRS